jgi:hypothetical protein
VLHQILGDERPGPSFLAVLGNSKYL